LNLPVRPRRVLVTGAGGQLGQDLVAAFSGTVPAGGRRCTAYGPGTAGPAGVEVVGADHRSLPVEDREAVMTAVDGLRPDVVVHAAAYTAVDACESERDRAMAVNALGTRHVAEGCRRVGAHLVYISTDYVFDGSSDRPYQEWDEPNPQSVYGLSKWGGEQECPPGAAVVRTSWVCGAHGSNMVKTALRLAEGEGPLRFVDDQHGSPTFTADLAPAVVSLALDRVPGTFHVTNQGSTTWFGFVGAVLSAAGHDPGRVLPVSTDELVPPRPARRPKNSVLDNAALRLTGRPLLPEWQDGLERLVGSLSGAGAAAA
jgi:dTDP-4-dehydrorhamnose reductase